MTPGNLGSGRGAAGGSESAAEAFSRIEASVDAGDTDLSALGFWRLLATVKVDPALAGRWAETAGRIDRKAFEAGVRFRVPVWLGNGLLTLGTLGGTLAVALALATPSPTAAGLWLLVAAGVWSVTVHDLAHWLVGRAVGIRFVAYFVGWRPLPPRPGLKIDYASYLRARPRGRAWMHASGAIATKLAAVAPIVFVPASGAPGWAVLAMLAFGAFAVATDLLFSFRLSDWKKVRRELRVARNQVSNP